MIDSPMPSTSPSKSWTWWPQAGRNHRDTSTPTVQSNSGSTFITRDVECVLDQPSVHTSYQQGYRHRSSPCRGNSHEGVNPLLTATVTLQLPKYTRTPPSMDLTGPARSPDLKEAHNPLLADSTTTATTSLRTPIHRSPRASDTRRNDDRERDRDGVSYVLIDSDGRRKNRPPPSRACCCAAAPSCAWPPSCAAACSCERPRLNTLAKALVMLAMLGGLVALVVVFSRKNQMVYLLRWVDKHKLGGAAIFGVLYTVFTVLFVPVLPLAIGGGAVYGVLWGSLIVWVSATTGETVAFLIGRFLLRDMVKAKASKVPLWLALERAIRYEGWKIILLLRLAPLIPFALINYFLGASAAQFHQFFWASVLGIIPGIVVNVYVGSTIRMIIIAHSSDPADPQHSLDVTTSKPMQIAALVVSAVAVLTALLLVGWYARRELLKIMNAHNGGEPSSPTGSASAPLHDHAASSTAGDAFSRSHSFTSLDAHAHGGGGGAPDAPPRPVEMSHSTLTVSGAATLPVSTSAAV